MTSEALSGPQDNLDRSRAFAWFSLIAGVLTALVLLTSLRTPTQTGEELLRYLSVHSGAVMITAVTILSWAVFSIPFVVGLGRLLRPKSPSLAQAAMLLSAIGIMVLAFGNFAGIGAVLAILAAGTPPSSAEAAYQVAIWRNLTFYLTDPGLMSWGLGQLLFGWLAWRSGVMPNWLAVVGIVGGVAGLFTLGVYQTPIMALLQITCFAIWAFSSAALLFRGQEQRGRSHMAQQA